MASYQDEWYQRNLLRERAKRSAYYYEHKEEYHERSTERVLAHRERYYAGVVCCLCGAEPIHYHHVDPDTKEYNPANMFSMTEDKIKSELEKCVPLCKACHARIHWDLNRES